MGGRRVIGDLVEGIHTLLTISSLLYAFYEISTEAFASDSTPLPDTHLNIQAWYAPSLSLSPPTNMLL